MRQDALCAQRALLPGVAFAAGLRQLFRQAVNHGFGGSYNVIIHAAAFQPGSAPGIS